MHKRTSFVPALVGTVLVGLTVLVLGNTVVQEELVFESNRQSLRALTGPLRWDLTPDGRDFDVFVGLNLFPAVWVLATAGLLLLASYRRDRWSFLTLFFSSLGALVGAAVTAAVVYWAYSELVLDSRLSGPFPDAYLLDKLHFTVSGAVDGPITIGLGVSLVVAVVGVLMGAGSPTATSPSPYAGSAVDPAPPMEPTGVAPVAPVSPTTPPPPTQAEQAASGEAVAAPPSPPPPPPAP